MMGLYEWLCSKGLSRKLILTVSLGMLMAVEGITLYILLADRVS